MSTYMVGYDLNKRGQDYDALIEAIKTYHWWHCLDSTWIIKTSDTPLQIRDRLQQYVDSNDGLLVIEVNRNAAWVGFSEECSDWLQANL